MSATLSQRVSLLGVRIDAVTPQSAVEELWRFLEEPAQRHVATPNNEMLVAAARLPSLAAVFNHTALNLPDSTGLLLAARLTGQFLPARVPGVDTVERLCSELTENHSVFLLGAAPGVAERAATIMRNRNRRLRIAGTFAGSPSSDDAGGIIRLINDSGAHLLLVAYGAPAQDVWIADHLAAMPGVRVAMGVGGTFDFIAGTVRRAPRFVRALGLEWAWRLFLQPKRWRRILNATVVFPYLVLRYGRNAPR
jgi:N-acetylglucosaminyldiphosphoundecaprenol N-acetyl-beta-D-mannosaminyltransferase